MNPTLKIFALLLLFGSTPLLAQSNKTLDEHFVDIIDNSNRYEDYKVVKRYKLDDLRKTVTDTIAAYKAEVSQLRSSLETTQTKVSELEQQVGALQTELTASQTAENEMSFFGSQTSKSTYKTIMWSIIGGLMFLLMIFVLRFKNSNSVTRSAKVKLKEVEDEYESHRQRSLEREQQIRRKLQDEINKNRQSQQSSTTKSQGA